MDKQLYETKKAADVEISKMMGWNAKPVKINVVLDNGDMTTRWAIQCDGTKYMRDDGYVR